MTSSNLVIDLSTRFPHTASFSDVNILTSLLLVTDEMVEQYWQIDTALRSQSGRSERLIDLVLEDDARAPATQGSARRLVAAA